MKRQLGEGKPNEQVDQDYCSSTAAIDKCDAIVHRRGMRARRSPNQ